ncbi:hypothetical protein [Streptomyces sp. LN245]|uniref:hypothetical protein n=1 Tax=Streptomyces sp. LN245 TaxID=3112975 RepID=UPI00371E1291
MNRLRFFVLAGAALLSAAACTGGAQPSQAKASTPTATRTSARAASPRATTPGRAEVIATARSHLLAQ